MYDGKSYLFKKFFIKNPKLAILNLTNEITTEDFESFLKVVRFHSTFLRETFK